jgi:hypothetical protein
VTNGKISYSERDVPLAEIESAAEQMVGMFGGSVASRDAQSVTFRLPRRRGVAASGEVAGSLSWIAEGEEPGAGTVTVTADEELSVPRAKRIGLLIAGVIGVGFFLVWPFFPGLGPLAWIGGAVAIAVYLLTLRTTQTGLVWALLQRVVELQLEREMVAEEGVES